MAEYTENLLQQAAEHLRSGRPAEAIRICEELLQSASSAPDQAQLHHLLGFGWMAVGTPDEAEARFRRAIALDDSPKYYNSLGVLLMEQGHLDDAISAYREALLRAPHYAAAHYNLGHAQRAKGEMEAAAESFRGAADSDPNHVNALAALGDALQALGRFPEAGAAYERALQLDPNSSRAWYAAGCAATSGKEYADAMAYFQRALELHADWPEAQHNLGRVLFELGQVEGALDRFRQAAAGGDSALPETAIAVVIPGDPASDNQAILNARRAWAGRRLPVRPAAERPRRAVETGSGRIRVGYVSSFFPHHNWMKPVWGLINHHDRRRFEIHLFSDAPASEIREGYCRDSQDVFHDTSGISNEALAKGIEQAEIDLLVDLNGYSTPGRLPLFAMRPAPIVVGWFNMYATTGIASYDYLIGDDVVIPAEEEKFYCERIARVPGSYLAFEVSYVVPEVADPPCLKKGAVTFGCLASQYKITTQVVEAWSRILERVPGSSLILKNRALASAGTREFVTLLFEQNGVHPERIRLNGPSGHYQFLESYGEMDIALDTFPYNGGTTTTEALWQGVPVVTFPGDRWVSRTSASILHAAGLSELAGDGLEGYAALAIRLASAPDRLLELRRSMRSRLRDSQACDVAHFAREMEQLYMEMISRNCAIACTK